VGTIDEQSSRLSLGLSVRFFCRSFSSSAHVPVLRSSVARRCRALHGWFVRLEEGASFRILCIETHQILASMWPTRLSGVGLLSCHRTAEVRGDLFARLLFVLGTVASVLSSFDRSDPYRFCLGLPPLSSVGLSGSHSSWHLGFRNHSWPTGGIGGCALEFADAFVLRHSVHRPAP